MQHLTATLHCGQMSNRRMFSMIHTPSINFQVHKIIFKDNFLCNIWEMLYIKLSLNFQPLQLVHSWLNYISDTLLEHLSAYKCSVTIAFSNNKIQLLRKSTIGHSGPSLCPSWPRIMCQFFMTDLIPIHRLNTYVGDEIVDALETTWILKYINHDACKDLPQHQHTHNFLVAD